MSYVVHIPQRFSWATIPKSKIWRLLDVYLAIQINLCSIKLCNNECYFSNLSAAASAILSEPMISWLPIVSEAFELPTFRLVLSMKVLNLDLMASPSILNNIQELLSQISKIVINQHVFADINNSFILCSIKPIQIIYSRVTISTCCHICTDQIEQLFLLQIKISFCNFSKCVKIIFPALLHSHAHTYHHRFD